MYVHNTVSKTVKFIFCLLFRLPICNEVHKICVIPTCYTSHAVVLYAAPVQSWHTFLEKISVLHISNNNNINKYIYILFYRGAVIDEASLQYLYSLRSGNRLKCYRTRTEANFFSVKWPVYV